MSEDEDEYWPDRIIAQKSVTYDVAIIREQLQETYNDLAENGEEPKKVSFEEVLDMIYSYAHDDFSCNWGHETASGELIVFDPDGEEY
ncbi:MAG: hypothetical protein RL463_997 [Bacteroidota bacterium]|jgi:hypothetical protein